MLEAMSQARIARDHEIDMMVQTLRSHRSAISDVANNSIRAEGHVALENKILFQYNHLNLPKLQFLKMTVIVWQVIHFLK